MSDTHIVRLLEKWEQDGEQSRKLRECTVYLTESSETKIAALAQLFELPESLIIADLLETSLKEIETSMPYKAGEKVIRVEDGDPVYEDIGLTPKYLTAKAKLKSLRQRK